MMPDLQNPYAPPGEAGRVCELRPPIAVSRFLIDGSGALVVLVAVQTLTGVATAVVVGQEQTSADSFVFGMALFAVILTALLTYAGGMRLSDGWHRLCWGAAISVIAWGSFLLGFIVTGEIRFTSSRLVSVDRTWLALVVSLTVCFVLLCDRCLRRMTIRAPGH